jgi:deoxyribodipyrimidine photo-lyase
VARGRAARARRGHRAGRSRTSVSRFRRCRRESICRRSGCGVQRTRLHAFLRDRVGGYPETRDPPGLDATSRLSPDLRWGTIGGAEAVRRALEAARDPARSAGARVWTRELAWRDFFAQLLVAHPRLAREPLRQLPVRWRHDERAFRRWQEAGRAFRWSMPACASCARPASCTTGRA